MPSSYFAQYGSKGKGRAIGTIKSHCFHNKEQASKAQPLPDQTTTNSQPRKVGCNNKTSMYFKIPCAKLVLPVSMEMFKKIEILFGENQKASIALDKTKRIESFS